MIVRYLITKTCAIDDIIGQLSEVKAHFTRKWVFAIICLRVWVKMVNKPHDKLENNKRKVSKKCLLVTKVEVKGHSQVRSQSSNFLIDVFCHYMILHVLGNFTKHTI